MVLYVSEKFHNNISNDFQLTERTQVHGRNGYVQRAITPKVGEPKLRFLFFTISHSALHLCEVL